MNKHRITHSIAGVCALAVLLGPAAHAAHADKGTQAATALLATGDHDQIEAGIQELGLIGTAEAVLPIVARIRQGLPPDLLETAIITLMALGQAQGAPVLFDLAAHRRPEIRMRALEALAVLGPTGAEAVLRNALSDIDPKVRSAAAVGLGDLKASASVETLFRALDRGNLEASTAIGKILNPDQVARLVSYLGKIPFGSLGPAIAEVLKRKDVSEREKLAVVGKLQEVGTPEVKTYLGEFLHSAGDSLSPALSRAILRVIQQIAN